MCAIMFAISHSYINTVPELKCRKRIVIVHLHDLLHLSPSDPYVPSIKQRKTHAVVKEASKRLVLSIRHHAYGFHRIRYTIYTAVTGENLRLQT